MWTVILNGLSSFFIKWFDNKSKISDAKAAYRIKELEAVTDYDTQAQRNMGNSWKDEYLILIHTFPIWGYMAPSEALTERLDLLWIKLEGAPQWWWWIYMGMIVSTFGLRFLANKLLKTRGL